LTKYVAKNINIHDTKFIQYESTFDDGSNGADIIFYMLVLFSRYLVKLCKVWLWLKPERMVNKNRGSMTYTQLFTKIPGIFLFWNGDYTGSCIEKTHTTFISFIQKGLAKSFTTTIESPKQGDKALPTDTMIQY
jgi:hypothetical protein